MRQKMVRLVRFRALIGDLHEFYSRVTLSKFRFSYMQYWRALELNLLYIILATISYWSEIWRTQIWKQFSAVRWTAETSHPVTEVENWGLRIDIITLIGKTSSALSNPRYAAARFIVYHPRSPDAPISSNYASARIFPFNWSGPQNDEATFLTVPISFRSNICLTFIGRLAWKK